MIHGRAHEIGHGRGQVGRARVRAHHATAHHAAAHLDLGTAHHAVHRAVGHAACRADYSVRFFRIPRLIDELARYAALQNKSTLLRQIAKADLLIIDDFGLSTIATIVARR